MRGLYPMIQPNQTWFFDREEGHRIYVEESGNPDGIALLFCHGGPGGASNAHQRRFYDPEVYRIIIFDQRGCGQSTPHAGLQSNTTWALLEDIEFIRQELGVERLGVGRRFMGQYFVFGVCH